MFVFPQTTADIHFVADYCMRLRCGKGTLMVLMCLIILNRLWSMNGDRLTRRMKTKVQRLFGLGLRWLRPFLFVMVWEVVCERDRWETSLAIGCSHPHPPVNGPAFDNSDTFIRSINANEILAAGRECEKSIKTYSIESCRNSSILQPKSRKSGNRAQQVTWPLWAYFKCHVQSPRNQRRRLRRLGGWLGPRLCSCTSNGIVCHQCPVCKTWGFVRQTRMTSRSMTPGVHPLALGREVRVVESVE